MGRERRKKSFRGGSVSDSEGGMAMALRSTIKKIKTVRDRSSLAEGYDKEQ